jgi:hypothetical protein
MPVVAQPKDQRSSLTCIYQQIMASGKIRTAGMFIASNVFGKLPMPTSPYAHVYPIIEYWTITRPASLLDVGMGNGKIGLIARDFLDVMLGERGKFKRTQKLRVKPSNYIRSLFIQLAISQRFTAWKDVMVKGPRSLL